MSEMNDELVLSTEKKVVFRPSRISDEQRASMALPEAAAKDKFTYGIAIQYEIIRMRLVSVNGKRPSAEGLEELDSLFTPREFKEIVKYLDSQEGEISAPRVTQVKSSGGA